MSDINIKSVYYYNDENVIRDEDGNVIFDIFKLITPNLLHLFKEKKETLFVTAKKTEDGIKIFYEFVFPEEEEN